MKKLILVYNPISGDATFKYKLDDIIAKFLQRDCIVIPYRTQRENLQPFRQFIRNIEVDGVIIAGGDGTLHEIVNIMIHEGIDLPIGIIASGTSNDFASFLGIDVDLDAYIDTIASGKTIPIDIGKIGEGYFINVASAGMLTCVAHEVDRRLKNALGKMAYYLRGLGELPHFRAFPMTIHADEHVFSEKVFLFLILNSGTVGSLKNVAVDAQVNDGLLDLLLVKKCKIQDLMSLTAELMAGKNITTRKNVIYLQAKNITIECAVPLDSDLDGELGPRLPLEIATLPGKMKLFYTKQ